MVKVRVELCARLVELAGVNHLTVDLPNKACLKDLLERLCQRFGKDFEMVILTPSAEYGHYLGVILINEREAMRMNDLETELKENDRIKIVPPVSGG